MVLSASRRTDIPAFYSDWFVNRLKAGYVLTRNPMNNVQISRITLSPEIVDCIVFWTKDPQNILDKLAVIDDLGYKYYFQFTLTPYGKAIEKNLRDKADIVKTFITLSKMIGKDRIIWRYDPIILNDEIDIDYHKKNFTRLCNELHKFTNSVTISFVDTYTKVKTNAICPITDVEIAELSEFIGTTAKSYGLAVNACCEGTDLTRYGISPASCIDRAVIEKICGCSFAIKRDKNQRSGCGCVESVDIGAYNTCQNGCVYCYANHSPVSVESNIKRHLSNGEMLIGTVMENEKITVRKIQSDKNEQMHF